MSHMTGKNLENIKEIFEAKTGTQLQGSRKYVPRKLLALALAALLCLGLAAFSYPLFTPLNGDELSLAAEYLGGGVIAIQVENRSDRDLQFQKTLKLYSWLTGEEIFPSAEEIAFSNTFFPAHDSGTMTVDLSQAYDIAALEAQLPGKPREMPYYLLLTNNSFLFGHDWICSVSFDRPEADKAAPEDHVSRAAENLEAMEEDLQFYFADSYQDRIMGLNEANFTYLQKVDELLKRSTKKLLHPLAPAILVADPSEPLDPQPEIRLEVQADGLQVFTQWRTVDGFSRLVGSGISEKALALTVGFPNQDSSRDIPLIFAFAFDAKAIEDAEYAFVYGQLVSLRELENAKVYQDAHYAIYDITDYLYSDLDGYLDDLQSIRKDLKLDEQIRQKIHTLREYYRDNLEDLIFCKTTEK